MSVNIRKVFRSIQDEISNAGIYNLNYGGCGIFAMYAMRELNKEGIDTEGVYIDGYTAPIQNCKSRFYYGSTPHHIAIRFRSGGRYIYFDGLKISLSGRALATNRWARVIGNCNLSDLEFVVPEKHLWNDIYDRSQNRKVLYAIKRGIKKAGTS